MILLDSFQLGGNSVQRLIPSDALKLPRSFGSLPPQGYNTRSEEYIPSASRAPSHACPELRFCAIVGFNSRDKSVFNVYFE
jgi:hypothetical protein